MEANSTTTDHETLPMLPSRSPGRYPQKTLVVAVICAFALGAIGASIVPAPQKATTSLTIDQLDQLVRDPEKPIEQREMGILDDDSQQSQEELLKYVLDCTASIDTCAEIGVLSAGSCLESFSHCLGMLRLFFGVDIC